MSKLMSASLTPAYGRDYESKAEVISAFKSGKDFCLQPQECYCSIRDFGVGASVSLYYGSLRRQAITEVNPEDFDNA